MRHEAIEKAFPVSDQKAIGPFWSTPSARICRSFIAARFRRKQFFKSSLFSEPAWDILLELFAADSDGRKLTISTVGLTANIPSTTVLRWLKVLEAEGLLEREDDSLDARRTFIRLSKCGFERMREYFDCGADA